MDENGVRVCECERPAHARLIAAAPDLLAALETGLDLLLNATHRETLTPWARETIAAMRAAIAKASATTTPADGRKGV